MTELSNELIVQIIFVIAVIVSLIITVIYNQKSHNQTERQLKLTTTEIKLRLKPSFVLEEAPGSRRQIAKGITQLQLRARNKGSVAADNIYVHMKISKEKIDPKEFLKEIRTGKNTSKELKGSILPNECSKNFPIEFSQDWDVAYLAIYAIYNYLEEFSNEGLRIYILKHNKPIENYGAFTKINIKKLLNR